MALTSIIPYDAPGNFNIDTNAQVSGGEASLKSIVPSSETLYTPFRTTDAVNTAHTPERGSKIFDLQNGAEVAGGFLDLDSAGLGQRAVIPDIAGLFATNKGAFKQTIELRFDSSVTYNVEAINIFNGIDNNLRVAFIQANTPTTSIYVKFTAGGVNGVNGTIVSGLTLNVGDVIEIAATWDFTTGNQVIYIDGVAVISTSSTAALDFSTGSLTLGDYGAADTPASYLVSQFQTFNTDYISSAYISPTPEQFTYDQTGESVELASTTNLDELLSFTHNATIPANTAVNYILKWGGQKYWWNGSNWVISNGSYAQSNIIADIQANLGSLPLSSGVAFTFSAVLKSDDGYTSPSVQDTTFTYGFFYSPTTVSKCIVYGAVYNSSGVAIRGATVTIDVQDHFNSGNFICQKVSAFSDTNGKFEVEVVETASVAKTANITIQYIEDGSRKSVSYNNVTIPNQPSELLENII